MDQYDFHLAFTVESDQAPDLEEVRKEMLAKFPNIKTIYITSYPRKRWPV